MEKKYLIDGASLIKIFLIKPDSAIDFIENSCTIESCYSEVGDLISNRCSMEETEEEKARITSLGDDLIDILKSVEIVPVLWNDFKTMLNIAIYKKLNFKEVRSSPRDVILAFSSSASSIEHLLEIRSPISL